MGNENAEKEVRCGKINIRISHFNIHIHTSSFSHLITIKNFKSKIRNYSKQASNIVFYLVLLFLPTQLGKHFWPDFSYIQGIRIDYLSPTLYLTDILMFILLVLFIINSKSGLKKNSKFKIQNSKLQLKIKNYLASLLSILSLKYKQLLIIIIILAVGIALSKNHFAGTYGLVKIFEFIFFGFYVSKKIKNLENLKKISAMFAIGIIFETLLSVAQYLSQSSIGGIFYFFGERTFNSQTPGIANVSLNGELMLRPYGTLSHPNVLAAYLIIGMTLMISKIKKVFFISILLLGTVALLLTMSRIAIIIWIFVVGYFIACYLKNNIKNKFTIYYLIFAIFIIGSVLILSPIHYRFTSFSFYDESIAIRKELILDSLIIIKERPLFGVGINNFLINLPDYQKINTGSFFTYLQPVHNIFLLIAAESGIIGLVFFIWFIVTTFKRIKSQELVKKKSVVYNSRFIILSIVLILGFFDHYFLTLQQGQLLFSFVLGLCWAQIKIDSKSKIRDNEFNQ